MSCFPTWCHILLRQILGTIAFLKGLLHCYSQEFSKLLTPLLQILVLCARDDTWGKTAALQSGGTFRHVKVWRNMCWWNQPICTPDHELNQIVCTLAACLAFLLEHMPSLLVWLVIAHAFRQNHRSQRFFSHSEFTPTSFRFCSSISNAAFPHEKFLIRAIVTTELC